MKIHVPHPTNGIRTTHKHCRLITPRRPLKITVAIVLYSVAMMLAACNVGGGYWRFLWGTTSDPIVFSNGLISWGSRGHYLIFIMPTLTSTQTSHDITLSLLCLQGKTPLISLCGILDEKSSTDSAIIPQTTKQVQITLSVDPYGYISWPS